MENANRDGVEFWKRKMLNQFRIAFLLLTMVVLISCQRDVALVKTTGLPTLELALVGKVSQQDFVLRQWFALPDSTRMRIDELKLYLSDIELQNTNGNWIPVKSYKLFDLSKSHVASKVQHGKGERLMVYAPAGTYQAIRFGMGLAPQYNGVDPTLFPNNHDLSVYQGMYWDWNSGYRFFLMEGLQDTSSIGSLGEPVPFAYHLGTDSLFETLEYEFSEIQLSSNRGGTLPPALDLELDLVKIFYSSTDTIRPAVEPVTHTSGNYPLAKRINHQLQHAWRVFPQ